MQRRPLRKLVIAPLALAACIGEPAQQLGCFDQSSQSSELELVACPLSDHATREALWFFIGLHNGTQQPVQLNRVLVLGEDLDAEMVGPSGDTLRLGGTIRLMQRPSRQTDMVLLPGETLGRSLNLACSIEEQARDTCGLFIDPGAPGMYTVTFRFSAKCEAEGCAPDVARWTGELTSASRRVQIRE